MQNPLLGDEQFNPTASDGRFAPVDIIDLVPGMEAENKRQRDAFDIRVQSMKENDQRKIRIAEQPSALEELGKFSETLTKNLVDIQDKKNKADMQRGMMRALSEGLSPEEQAQFDADEAVLTEGKVVADKEAEVIEEETGNVFLADRVRGLSGWEKYGYEKGRIQNGAAGYPAFLATAKEEASVVIDGDIVTFENATEPEEFAALQAQVSSKFLEQFAGTNPALLNKYLFPTIRQENSRQAIKFAAERQQARQQELKDGRKNELYLGIRSNQENVIQEYILNHPKGAGAGKRELAALLDAGLKNGSITGEYVQEQIFQKELTFNDGSRSTLAGKDPGIFAGLEQAAEDAIAGRIDRDSRDLADQKQKTENQILTAITEMEGEMTEANSSALIQVWRDAHPNSPLPDSLKDAITAGTDVDKDEARIRLKAIIDERGYLTEEDCKGYPKLLMGDFPNSIRSTADAAPTSTMVGEANDAISARLGEITKETDGLVEKTAEYRRQERLAKRAYILKYNQGLNKNLTPEQAHEAAIISVDKNIQARTYSVKEADTGNQTFIDRVDGAVKTIKQNKNSAVTGQYLNDTEMEEGKDYIEGTGSAPAVATAIARQLGIPTYDFVKMQLKYAGIEPDTDRPEVEDNVDKLDPAVQDLLRRQSSLSRTTRAVTQTDGDTAFFLDAVASVESKSYGEYDAMNVGGSGMGVNNTAYGSANSCDVTGCISSMTLGEVMSLQSQGKLFAAGRYQFIPSTLAETAQQLGLSMDTPFDAATQDALAIGRLRWRLGVQNSLTGLRTEWQGLWKIPAAEAQEVLDAGRAVVSVYNQPQNILPALRSN